MIFVDADAPEFRWASSRPAHDVKLIAFLKEIHNLWCTLTKLWRTIVMLKSGGQPLNSFLSLICGSK